MVMRMSCESARSVELFLVVQADTRLSAQAYA